MQNHSLLIAALFLTAFFCYGSAMQLRAQVLFPADKATMVNPDVQLRLTLRKRPQSAGRSE